MTQTAVAVARAFQQLQDLSRTGIYPGQSQLFALTWLAAARMALDNGDGAKSLETLADSVGWSRLVDAGFPSDAVDALGGDRSHDVGRRAHCVSVLQDLCNASGTEWDVLPLLVNARRSFEIGAGLLPSLAIFLLDLVGAAPASGGELWIPFDGIGQLTIEALRRGWTVCTASPLTGSRLPLDLLLTIETGRPDHPRINRDVPRTRSATAAAQATHVLVVPPFGVPTRESRLAVWDSTGAIDHFGRSESWAIYEFLNRATERAVFTVPAGVLFSRGQEERLREYILHRGGENNELEAVIALPPGVFVSAPGVSGAVIIVTPGKGHDATEMMMLGGGRRSTAEADEILKQEHEHLAGAAPAPARATGVTRDQIAQQENSLAPARYLRRVSEIGPSVKLGDVCQAIRPPSVAKTETPYIAHEVGISDLNVWRPIQTLPTSKQKPVYLRTEPKPSTLLRPGDIVVSIKGSIGKAAMVGEIATSKSLVPSQSCLGLRVSDAKLTPEYVLTYLRSAHGQAQLQGLQVGTAIQHVSPNTLLSLALPVPTLASQEDVKQDFAELCALEEARARAELQMEEVQRRRWILEEDSAWA